MGDVGTKPSKLWFVGRVVSTPFYSNWCLCEMDLWTSNFGERNGK